jgi:hypothetical protein
MDYFGRGIQLPIGLVSKFGAVISTTTATDAGADGNFGTIDDITTQYFPDGFGRIKVLAPIGHQVKIGLATLNYDPPYTAINNCPTSATTFTITPWVWPAPAVGSELLHTMTTTDTQAITAMNNFISAPGVCP